jgi:AcrR family transcriptional regulator
MSNPGAAGAADRTRALLLRKALTLFANEGIKGVSLRRIVTASGAANKSALHYHFGKRWAVVTALAAQIFERLRSESLPRLAALPPGQHDVRDVLHALYLPVVELREEGATGHDAVRFLARLSWEFGKEGQGISGAGLNELADAATARLIPLLPHKTPDEIRLHLLMSMTNVFHGLADYEYIHVVPFGPKGLLGAELGRRRLELFFDYLEAGLRAAPSRQAGTR